MKAKRILVTLRCEQCGVDLSPRDDKPLTALLRIDKGAVFCNATCEANWTAAGDPLGRRRGRDG